MQFVWAWRFLLLCLRRGNTLLFHGLSQASTSPFQGHALTVPEANPSLYNSTALGLHSFTIIVGFRFYMVLDPTG